MAKTIKMTADIARAAARDAANRRMRAAGRTEWDLDDYGLACDTMKALYPQGFICSVFDCDNESESERNR